MRTHKPWRDSDTVFVIFGFSFLLCASLVHHAVTHIEGSMKKAVPNLPAPECGWFAALVCTEMSEGDRECHWDKTWRCGYGLSWPHVVVRRPFAEEVIKERYP